MNEGKDGKRKKQTAHRRARQETFEVQRLRFDDVIHKLSTEEFFICEATTLRIIKRMLMEGATVDGQTVKRSRYMGFRSLRKQKSSSSQLSLFPE